MTDRAQTALSVQQRLDILTALQGGTLSTKRLAHICGAPLAVVAREMEQLASERRVRAISIFGRRGWSLC